MEGSSVLVLIWSKCCVQSLYKPNWHRVKPNAVGTSASRSQCSATASCQSADQVLAIWCERSHSKNWNLLMTSSKVNGTVKPSMLRTAFAGLWRDSFCEVLLRHNLGLQVARRCVAYNSPPTQPSLAANRRCTHPVASLNLCNQLKGAELRSLRIVLNIFEPEDRST